MRIVLFTNGEFPPGSSRAAAESWAREYAAELAKRGRQTVFFGPSLGALFPDDLVHSVGPAFPEDWYWIRRRVKALIVSPLPGETPASWPPRPTALEKIAHAWRKGSGRFAHLRSVDQFQLLSANATTAAEEIDSVYGHFGT